MHKDLNIIMIPALSGTSPKNMIVMCKVVPNFTDINNLPFKIGQLVYSNSNPSGVLDYFTPQHLYFLTENTVELIPGQWCYNSTTKRIERFTHDTEFIPTIMHQVEFSTNIALGLPKPSKLFLQKYCEEQGIAKVQVEYTDPMNEPFVSMMVNLTGKELPQDFLLPKLNDKFEITINPVKVEEKKTTWSEEEVDTLIEKVTQRTARDIIAKIEKDYL